MDESVVFSNYGYGRKKIISLLCSGKVGIHSNSMADPKLRTFEVADM